MGLKKPSKQARGRHSRQLVKSKKTKVKPDKQKKKNSKVEKEKVKKEEKPKKVEKKIDVEEKAVEKDEMKDLGKIGEVDLVYTWVNGADPQWRADRKKYLRLSGVKSKASYEEDRYRNLNELKYSLRSVHQFAPWVRHIFIVTCGQVPDWLDLNFSDEKKVTVVSHSEIFADDLKKECLPTFNSVAIEANLHRIPGLSEYFIYFNDDVFFGRSVKISDFIDVSSGRTRIFLRNKSLEVRFSGYSLSDYNYRDSMSYTQKKLNQILGLEMKTNRKALQHLGCCLRKSVLGEIEEVLRGCGHYTQTCSRFRRNDNINLITYFYPHYCLEKGYGIPCLVSQGVSISHDHDSRLEELLRKKYRMFCLNSLEDVSPQLKKFYRQYFSKAPWEKSK